MTCTTRSPKRQSKIVMDIHSFGTNIHNYDIHSFGMNIQGWLLYVLSMPSIECPQAFGSASVTGDKTNKMFLSKEDGKYLTSWTFTLFKSINTMCGLEPFLDLVNFKASTNSNLQMKLKGVVEDTEKANFGEPTSCTKVEPQTKEISHATYITIILKWQFEGNKRSMSFHGSHGERR